MPLDRCEVFRRWLRGLNRMAFDLRCLVTCRQTESHRDLAVVLKIVERLSARRRRNAEAEASPVAAHVRPPGPRESGQKIRVASAYRHGNAALDERFQSIVDRNGHQRSRVRSAKFRLRKDLAFL